MLSYRYKLPSSVGQRYWVKKSPIDLLRVHHIAAEAMFTLIPNMIAIKPGVRTSKAAPYVQAQPLQKGGRHRTFRFLFGSGPDWGRLDKQNRTGTFRK